MNLNKQEVKSFFNLVRQELMNDAPCDERNEDSIFYSAVDRTREEFDISDSEVYECLQEKI